ncbi:Exodeoxyribonuclease 1 [Neolecta irregularis DAH-3]|uniref:Exodeoxyribonuclease 1 n=1 Tax=Neolecta irregularis (strain DAH-3) TaxID=1198029 RepID=A0A1U7LRQ8_NEOID|nr:Exodeoxyribonuclease 1 [Neolecta irregularis DAH-3]|eukprot:OLL25356.1 Exodeoxyribonuclease 1 [Neolecta irregularis DAH-3]
MGIHGLLPALKSIQQKTHIRAFAGQTVGVDAYVWLYKGAFACAFNLALGKDTTKYVDYVMHRVKMLRHYNVRPYIVLDGGFLPSKAKTEIERKKRRADSRALGLKFLAQGQKKKAMEQFKRCLDITPEMAHRFIIACNKHIDYIVAPYEADAQLAYLEKKGLISAIITEDSDLLVYGCKKVLFKMDQCGECIEIDRSRFAATADIKLAGFSDDTFRHMAMLSGCDYLSNIPNLGLKKAHKYLYKYKTIDRFFRAMALDPTIKIPDGYEQDFYKADLTFRHQRVFCPVSNTLVMLNEPENPALLEGQDFIGPLLLSHIAQGIAQGYLCPVTKKPFRHVGTSGKENIPPKSLKKTESCPKPGSIESFFGSEPVLATATSSLSLTPLFHIVPPKRSLEAMPISDASERIAKRIKVFSQEPTSANTPTITQSCYFTPPNSQQSLKFRAIHTAAKEAMKPDVADSPITPPESQVLDLGEPEQIAAASTTAVNESLEKAEILPPLEEYCTPTPKQRSSNFSTTGPSKFAENWKSRFSNQYSTPTRPDPTKTPFMMTSSLPRLGIRSIEIARTKIRLSKNVPIVEKAAGTPSFFEKFRHSNLR